LERMLVPEHEHKKILEKTTKLKANYARYVTTLQAKCEPKKGSPWWSLGSSLFPWKFSDNFLTYGLWRVVGHSTNEYKTCHVKRDEEVQQPYELKRLNGLLKNMGGRGLEIVSAEAIYNEHLLKEFEQAKQNLATSHRCFPKFFKLDTWKTNEQEPTDIIERRKQVMENYDNLVKNTDWNKYIGQYDIPIFPAVHCCSYDMAIEIAQSGFDIPDSSGGSYGEGVYLTTSANYAQRNIPEGDCNTMVICYAAPGNVYPAVEDPQGKQSLVGADVKAGYQSHYAVVNEEGLPAKWAKQSLPNEIVMFDYSLILPVYIVKVRKNEDYIEDEEESVSEAELAPEPSPQTQKQKRHKRTNSAWDSYKKPSGDRRASKNFLGKGTIGRGKIKFIL